MDSLTPIAANDHEPAAVVEDLDEHRPIDATDRVQAAVDEDLDVERGGWDPLPDDRTHGVEGGSRDQRRLGVGRSADREDRG